MFLLFRFLLISEFDDNTPNEGWNAYYGMYDTFQGALEVAIKMSYGNYHEWCDFQIVDLDQSTVLMDKSRLITSKQHEILCQLIGNEDVWSCEFSRRVMTGRIPFENAVIMGNREDEQWLEWGETLNTKTLEKRVKGEQ